MTRTRKVVLNIGAIVTAAGGVFGFVARPTVRFVDTRYVHADAFAAFQQGLAEQRSIDSVSRSYEWKDVRRMLAGLDSSDRCRRGQTAYCR